MTTCQATLIRLTQEPALSINRTTSTVRVVVATVLLKPVVQRMVCSAQAGPQRAPDIRFSANELPDFWGYSPQVRQTKVLVRTDVKQQWVCAWCHPP